MRSVLPFLLVLAVSASALALAQPPLTEPEGARLAVKGFTHDYGNYYEVVCYFTESLPDSVTYAYKCESDECPSEWPPDVLEG